MANVTQIEYRRIEIGGILYEFPVFYLDVNSNYGSISFTVPIGTHGSVIATSISNTGYSPITGTKNFGNTNAQIFYNRGSSPYAGLIWSGTQFATFSGQLGNNQIGFFIISYANGVKHSCLRWLPSSNVTYANATNERFGYYSVSSPVSFDNYISQYDALYRAAPHAAAVYNNSSVIPQDPYADGGISETGGGTGTFDLTGDDIDIPNLPTLSATNAGLVTVYIPTASELRNFGELIFGSTFLNAFLNAVTNLFVDPLEAIVGLAILPVSPSVGELQDVKVGFVPLNYTEEGVGYRLQMHPATSQYVVVDCGSLTVEEYSGSALDYAPYSKFHVYLPYIGTRELSTDEIRNKTMHIVYHVDIVSGACVAIIEVDGTVLYQFAGNCATPIPINGRDFSRMITASIQLAGAFVGASSGSGSGTAVAGNPTPSDSPQVSQASFSTLGDDGTKPDTHKQPGRKASGEHLISTTASVVAGMKTHIQHASGIGGSAGMLGVQKPYLIAEIPRQSLAEDYNKFIGYPSNITSLLSDLEGFTQIEMIHLKDIPCTETELAEINDMLMEGVIL